MCPFRDHTPYQAPTSNTRPTETCRRSLHDNILVDWESVKNSINGLTESDREYHMEEWHLYGDIIHIYAQSRALVELS